MANHFTITVNVISRTDLSLIDLMDYLNALLLDSDIEQPFDPDKIILSCDDMESVILG